MAMQTNLSKKDKMTIAIVLFAGAVFGLIWFLIRPTVTSILTTTEKIIEEKATQNNYKNKIIFLTSGEALYEKAVNDLNDSTADYYDVMDSAEIDKMVTSYVLQSGLFAENLVIELPKSTVEEVPYTYSSISTPTSYSSSDDEDVEDDEVTITTDEGVDALTTPYMTARNNCTSTASSGVTRVGITLVVTGSKSACQAFIDDICTKPGMRIESFSWDTVEMIEQYDPETSTVTLVDPGTVRLHISLYLYMVDVADYQAVLSDAAAGSED